MNFCLKISRSPFTIYLTMLLSVALFAGCQPEAEKPPVTKGDFNSEEGSGTHSTADAATSGTSTTPATTESTMEAGEIIVAGSSTVEPVSAKMAEMVAKDGMKVKVSGGGSGAGMKQLASGKLDIADSSRKMKSEEAEECKKNGIEYVSLQVGVDGITVVVNKKNTFCKCLTVEQLKKLWEKDSKVKTWKELDPTWPDQEIKLYGPDANSGTFDYFCEEILKTKKKEGEVLDNETQARSRRDYERSADDNVLVKGVSEDEFALGYFGYSFYVNNKEILNSVAISKTDKYEDGVMPNDESIDSGKYSPLSRPLFIYVNKSSLKRPEVKKFLNFYLEHANEVVKEVNYINVKPEIMEANKKSLEEAISSMK